MDRRFGGTYRLQLQCRKDPRAINQRKQVAAETSVHTRSTWGHIPEDGILHSHRRENFKPYTFLLLLLLTSHFFLEHPSGIFRIGFPTKVSHTFFLSLMHGLEYTYFTNAFTYLINLDVDLLQIKSTVQKMNSRYYTTQS
jgi:hypothetical protein